MKFRNEKHESDYKCVVDKMKKQDCQHQAIAYLLTLDEMVASHIEEVFAIKEDMAMVATALEKEWQTETSRVTTRLIFNLWRGHYKDFNEGKFPTSGYYTVVNVFRCKYAPYYWEAIKLYYPEYCNGGG